MESPLRIGVSSCLLGQEVRYDRGHKRDAFLTDVLGRYVEWLPVCPEVEIGLGTPRPTLRLERIGGEARMVMPSTGEDYTEPMRRWAEARVEQLAAMELDGYVLKKDSPSCGLLRVKLYPAAERPGGPMGAPTRDGQGLFARALTERLPHLPVEEEGRLHDAPLRENFIARAFVHQRWRQAEKEGWARASLMGFHERHKFLLMARNQAGMRRLGRLLGESARRDDPRALAREYQEDLTAVMRRPPTRRGHTNVLQRLLGFFSDRLEKGDRDELVETIDRYRQGLLPLVVPLTLIRHHVRRLGVEYLQGQCYLEPHPHELMLLNHV